MNNVLRSPRWGSVSMRMVFAVLFGGSVTAGCGQLNALSKGEGKSAPSEPAAPSRQNSESSTAVDVSQDSNGQKSAGGSVSAAPGQDRMTSLASALVDGSGGPGGPAGPQGPGGGGNQGMNPGMVALIVCQPSDATRTQIKAVLDAAHKDGTAPSADLHKVIVAKVAELLEADADLKTCLDKLGTPESVDAAKKAKIDAIIKACVPTQTELKDAGLTPPSPTMTKDERDANFKKFEEVRAKKESTDACKAAKAAL